MRGFASSASAAANSLRIEFEDAEALELADGAIDVRLNAVCADRIQPGDVGRDRFPRSRSLAQLENLSGAHIQNMHFLALNVVHEHLVTDGAYFETGFLFRIHEGARKSRT